MALYVNKLGAGIEDRTNERKLWQQTKVTLRLIISYFNWIWVHSRLGTTAAQRADMTLEPWTWEDIATYPTLC